MTRMGCFLVMLSVLAMRSTSKMTPYIRMAFLQGGLLR